MKTLLLLALLVLPIVAPAQTNKVAPWREQDRVWDSIGANHRPIAAKQYYNCWFVLCEPIHPFLKDNYTVYYDPAIIEIKPIPATRPRDVAVIIRKGNNRKVIAIERLGTNDYRWIKLEPKALLAAVEQIQTSSSEKK
jgi:hypothetical protein